MTDATGLASCVLAPHEQAGAYQVTASYVGSSVPFLAPVNTSAPFTVTLEQDALTYTGSTSTAAGQPLVLSGMLTTDDPAAEAALAGRTVRLTLGTGPGAVGCNGLTDASGKATCIVIVPPMQAAGNVPVSAVFVSDGLFEAAAASGTVAVTASAVVATPEVGAGRGVPWAPVALCILGGTAIACAGRRRRWTALRARGGGRRRW
jgi:hypothetical protein